MSAFLSSLNLMELNEYTICLRIALSMLLGSILGAERTRKRRGAGLRTYTLVCLGATVVMMTGQFMMEYFGDTDPARLGAQVVSGIGFLGAGTILVTGAQKIKGLTTAAGLWAAACLGIAIGIGFYIGVLFMFCAMLLVMTILNYAQKRYVAKCRRMQLYILFETLNNLFYFTERMKSEDIKLEDFELDASVASIGVGVTIQIYIKGGHTHKQVIDIIEECGGLTMADEI